MKLFPSTSLPQSIRKILSMEGTLKSHIFNVVSRFPGLSSDKEDIFQEVMIALLKNPEKIDHVVIEAYAKSIAYNKCVNRLKEKGRSKTLLVESVPDAPAEDDQPHAFTISHSELMGLALKELKPECFQVLHLYYYEEGLSKDRLIASTLRQKPDAIKQRRGRCQEALKAIITSNKKYEELVFLIPPSKRK